MLLNKETEPNYSPFRNFLSDIDIVITTFNLKQPYTYLCEHKHKYSRMKILQSHDRNKMLLKVSHVFEW